MIFLVLLIRFPIKRLSSPKQQSKRATKPVTENPPPQTARGRQAKKKQDEEEEKEEDKEEVLSQSLKKRDKNIQENKAMVTNSYFPLWFFSPMFLLNVYIISLTLVSSVDVFQLAKLFADLSTMADLTLPTTPQVSTRANRNDS